MNIRIQPATRAFIEQFVAEEITTLIATDPFGIDDPCPFNPEGHFQFWDGPRTLVCAHCSRILWSA